MFFLRYTIERRRKKKVFEDFGVEVGGAAVLKEAIYHAHHQKKKKRSQPQSRVKKIP